jgi:hypothetical protein
MQPADVAALTPSPRPSERRQSTWFSCVAPRVTLVPHSDEFGGFPPPRWPRVVLRFLRTQRPHSTSTCERIRSFVSLASRCSVESSLASNRTVQRAAALATPGPGTFKSPVLDRVLVVSIVDDYGIGTWTPALRLSWGPLMLCPATSTPARPCRAASQRLARDTAHLMREHQHVVRGARPPSGPSKPVGKEGEILACRTSQTARAPSQCQIYLSPGAHLPTSPRRLFGGLDR